MQTADALAGTPAEFKSQLLANELDQLRLLPSGSITPATLTTPIVSRRELVAAPTTFLHRRAQQLVFSATSTMFLSGVGSYSAWAWQLLDATTSAGLGVLISVATLRWAIARWEKAQKRWWEDWQRIGQGLARDVQVRLSDLSMRRLTLPFAVVHCRESSCGVWESGCSLCLSGCAID